MKSTSRHQVFLRKKKKKKKKKNSKNVLIRHNKKKKKRKLQDFNMLADPLSSLSVFWSPVWQNQFVETIGFDK